MENENEQVEEMKARRAPQMEMMKNSLTSSKCEGPLQSGGTNGPWDPASRVIGSFIGMGMVGFCFGIGAILAIKMVNSLEELMSRK